MFTSQIATIVVQMNEHILGESRKKKDESIKEVASDKEANSLEQTTESAGEKVIVLLVGCSFCSGSSHIQLSKALFISNCQQQHAMCS